MTLGQRRWVAAVVALAALAAAVPFLSAHAGWWRDRLLFVNPNTIRDFEVYGQFRHGRLPLQGPVTSIGGNHGWLAYWLFGLPLAAWPYLRTLYAVSTLALLITWAASTELARRIAPGVPSGLAVLVLPATYVSFLVYFPNHIVWLLAGSALAFLGLVHARERASWALLTTSGLALAMGSHRFGFVLLLAVFVLDRRLALGVFRRPIAWVPLALYAVPELLAQLLGGSATPTEGGRLTTWLSDIDPFLVIRQMPFATVPIRPVSALQVVQVAWVVAVVVLARPAAVHPAARAAWWFYVVCGVGLLLVHHDTQYYFPMLTVLPLLTALATSTALATRWGWGWVIVSLAVLGASGREVIRGTVAEDLMQLQGLHSVRNELTLVRALGRHGITGPELWERTNYEPLGPHQYVGYLASALLPLPDEVAGHPRCFHLRPLDEVAAPGAEQAVTVGDGHRLWVTEGPSCPVQKPLARVDSPIWYLDLTRGELTQR